MRRPFNRASTSSGVQRFRPARSRRAEIPPRGLRCEIRVSWMGDYIRALVVRV